MLINNKLFVGFLIGASLSSSLMAKTFVIDNLNETKHINVSESDVNRFVFPYNIKTQISSKEKDLTINTVGKEMYIKFVPYQEQTVTTVGDKLIPNNDSKILYNKSKTNEIFVVTEKKTYSFIVHPKKQEASTFIMTESFSDKKENMLEVAKKDSEYVDEIANEITLPILKGSTMRGYETRELKHSWKQVDDSLSATLNKEYIGLKYTIKEYLIKNNTNESISIDDTKNIIYSVFGNQDTVVSYSLYYGNRIYKILPSSSAKLIIIKHTTEEDR